MILVTEGRLKEAHSFASLKSPLILADPTVPQEPGKTRLIVQWGELFGHMTRVGDAEPLNDLDRAWLAFYSPKAAVPENYTNLAEPTITLSKTQFQPGEPIAVQVSGLPGNPKDWLTVAPAANPPNVWGREYQYTQGKTAGTWTFWAPTEAGAYEVRVYYNDGYDIRASAGIEVGTVSPQAAQTKEARRASEPETGAPAASGEATPQISLPTTTFKRGEAIEVSVSGLPGNQADWITVAPADYPANRWGSEYKYTQGATEGTWSFWAPNAPGTYQVRVYFNNGYDIKAKAEIKVVAP
jgi:hypothetical protein